jgi:conjugal transfer ATP-binding protein TraC
MIERTDHLTKYLERVEQIPRLHQLLPYEIYDPTSQLFYNQGSTGFVLLASPIVGASLSDQHQMAGFFRQESNLPEGASLQFLLFASPCIGPHLNYWHQARKGDVFQKLAERRAQFLADKVFDPDGLLVRDFKILISYTLPGHLITPNDQQQIQATRRELKAVLETLGIYATNMDAQGLIREVGDILNINQSIMPHAGKWNENDAVAKEIVDPDKNFFMTPNGIYLNDGKTICRSYVPKHPPRHWSLSQMDHFLGNLLETRHKIPCPYLMHFGLFVNNGQGQSKTKALTKRESQERSLKNGLLKFVPNLREQYEESIELVEQLQLGERVILSNLSCTIFADANKVQEAEQNLRNIWQSNGWLFEQTRYDHLTMLLSSLPMTWTLGEKRKALTKKAYGFATALKSLDKAKLTITKEAQNMLPLLGEWKGQASPGMPLIGRRGQLFFWNPFGKALLPGETNAQTDHNYNVCIAGQSGSGKSVFMNELMATVMGVGGKVFVLDLGRSFKNNCQIVGGQHIEFDIRTPLSLNPFTHVPEDDSAESICDREEMLSTICPIFQVMASPKHGTKDLENAYLEQAIRQSWDKYQSNSSVDTVRNLLLERQEVEAKNLGQTLFSFCSEGSFGHFFNGPATASFKDKLVVIETDHLRNYPTLMAVVVQMLIIQINQEMSKGDRQTPFLIIIDEAWKLLSGKNTAEFISEASRTARKYKGSIVLGTQHLTDYFKEESPAATEAFNCAAWKCILYQESDVITSLTHHDQLQGFVDSEYKEALLRSIHSKPPHYSEVAIFGPGINGVVGRLRLDPFSRLLYSTNAEEYRLIEQLRHQGASIEQAIEAVIEHQAGTWEFSDAA